MRSQVSPLEYCRSWFWRAAQNSGRVFAEEVGGQGSSNAFPKSIAARVAFSRQPEITMAIASRAGQLLLDLGVAVGHDATSEPVTLASGAAERSSHRLVGAEPARLNREAPFTRVWLKQYQAIFDNILFPNQIFCLSFA